MTKKKNEGEDTNDQTSPPEGMSKAEQIIKLYTEHPEMSYREIAETVGTKENYVTNIISRYNKKQKGKMPQEIEPLDELEYLKRIIISTWGNPQKADLIISLFKDHDPDDLRILYSLLNKAQCPKTSQELIIYSWAKHRHIPATQIKDMFKNNKAILRTFKELGYFDETDVFGEEEEEEEEEKEKEGSESVEKLMEDLEKQRVMELKRKLEELKLKKMLKELEKQVDEFEDSGKKEDFDWDFEGEGNWPAPPMAEPQPVMRKVVRPAINPATGEILKDENGNIIFETVEEPVNGPAHANTQDDMMRWMLALQQTKKEDPEKELLRKEIEELKHKMEEEEKRKKEEEERKRYEEQIKAMQEQMQDFQQQVMQMIQQLQENKGKEGQVSFEQQLLMKLLEDKDKVPPEVMQIIQEEREIIKKLQEKPQGDEEKKMLMGQIEELKKTLEKKELDSVFNKYNQYINALYQKIEALEKDVSQKNSLSDDKYKIDRIIDMDKERVQTTKEMIDKTTDTVLSPAMKIAMEQMRQQDMWNKYMMLLQEEQRRNLPPGTLIDRFFGAPKVSEDEKKRLLDKIDEEIGKGE